MKEKIEKKRIYSIDFLRGIVMLLMLLDHIRDLWTDASGTYRSANLINVDTWLFFTRWITHFCAPVFLFLSGVSIYLAKRMKNQSENTVFLAMLRRGIILIILEIIIISPVRGYFFFKNGILLQVIWAIGVSMIIMGFFQYLKSWMVGFLGIFIITLHNFIPAFEVTNSTSGFFLSILHQVGIFKLFKNWTILVAYPIIPWIGVMAFGYGAGEIFFWERSKRRKLLIYSGCFFIILFMIFKFFNIYGDPARFEFQDSTIRTIVSLLNNEKYPPSFLYLMMTLGPAFLMLSWLEKFHPSEINPFVVFGKTALFFYIVHLYIIKITAYAVLLIIKYSGFFQGEISLPFNFNLWVVYFVWIILIAVHYPICRIYYRMKFVKRLWWTAYL